MAVENGSFFAARQLAARIKSNAGQIPCRLLFFAR
jgi:hypothetical protein